jgi:hypothetical protein
MVMVKPKSPAWLRRVAIALACLASAGCHTVGNYLDEDKQHGAHEKRSTSEKKDQAKSLHDWEQQFLWAD